MIGRRPSKVVEESAEELRGFDAYKVRLGDVMRGERATLGKSLLDVQRELRIKAAYIAAIENCDPHAFDTPGFIAGYVRSYARYLNMDPDACFATFCAESGFEVHHGMSAKASGVKKTASDERSRANAGRDVFNGSTTPFVPATEAFLSSVEPRAVGSVLVLIALIGGIGYGGWTVLQEIQRVTLVPADQSPTVLSDFDGTDPSNATPQIAPEVDADSDLAVTRAAALDRLYRPQALDVPVLVARDAPIATLDPRDSGAFADAARPDDDLPFVSTDTTIPPTVAPVPRVVEDLGPTIRMVAAYPSWVRVRSAEGNTLFEGIMEAGDTWDVPATEEAPNLRTGESGAIYFAMGTHCFGPVGASGEVSSNVALELASLSDNLQLVTPGDATSALNQMFADLRQVDPVRLAKLPCQTN